MAPAGPSMTAVTAVSATVMSWERVRALRTTRSKAAAAQKRRTRPGHGGPPSARAPRSLAAKEADRRFLELLHQAERHAASVEEQTQRALLTGVVTTGSGGGGAGSKRAPLSASSVASATEPTLAELALMQAMAHDQKRRRRKRRRDGDDDGNDAANEADHSDDDGDNDGDSDSDSDNDNGGTNKPKRSKTVPDDDTMIHVADKTSSSSVPLASTSSASATTSEEESQSMHADVEAMIERERRQTKASIARAMKTLEQRISNACLNVRLAGTEVMRKALMEQLQRDRAELRRLRSGAAMSEFEAQTARFRREYGAASSAARARGHGLAREMRPHTVLGAPKPSFSSSSTANLANMTIRSGALTGSSLEIRRDLTDRFATEVSQWRQRLSGPDVTEAPPRPTYVMRAEICEECFAPMCIIANDSLLGCPRCHKVRTFEQPTNSVSANIAQGDSASGSGTSTGTGTAAARSQNASSNTMRYLTLGDLTTVVGTPTGTTAVCMHEARLRRYLLAVNETLQRAADPARRPRLQAFVRSRLAVLAPLVRRARDFGSTSSSSAASLSSSAASLSTLDPVDAVAAASAAAAAAAAAAPVWIPLEAILEALKLASAAEAKAAKEAVAAVAATETLTSTTTTTTTTAKSRSKTKTKPKTAKKKTDDDDDDDEDDGESDVDVDSEIEDVEDDVEDDVDHDVEDDVEDDAGVGAGAGAGGRNPKVVLKTTTVNGWMPPPAPEIYACFEVLNGFLPPRLSLIEQERIVTLFRAVAALMLPRVTGNVPPSIHPWFARVACTLLGWREASGAFALPPASTHTRLMTALEDPARELEWDFDGMAQAVTMVRAGSLALTAPSSSLSALRGNARFRFQTATTATLKSGGFLARSFTPDTLATFDAFARRRRRSTSTATATALATSSPIPTTNPTTTPKEPVHE